MIVTLGWFAHINKSQKDSLNESAESFTDSLLSGGPSSITGSSLSSAASTNGTDESLELGHNTNGNSNTGGNNHDSATIEEAAAYLSQNKQQHHQQQQVEKRNQIKKNIHQHQIRKHRVNGSASSSSLSSASSPSLSGDDGTNEDDEDDEDLMRHGHLYHEPGAKSRQNRNNNHRNHNHHRHAHGHPHNHHHHHNSHHQKLRHHNLNVDDGYGSRSSDYSVPNSLMSPEPITKRNRNRNRFNHHSNQQQQKQQQHNLVIKISSINEGNVTTTTGENIPCTVTGNKLATNGDNLHSTSLYETTTITTALQQAQTTKDCITNADLSDIGKQHDHLDNNNQTLVGVNNELEYKLKQFRQRTRAKLIEQDMPEELADVPVFHCTSGGENPITWGQVQILVLAALSIFPSTTTYRYPCGSFTNNQKLDDFYRLTLHYIPGAIVDFITKLFGGEPKICRIFKKFDQAAGVLKAFTIKEWQFNYDNRLFLMNELMNDEDRRLFNCDISSLDWKEFISDYVVGVRKFLLKEPMDNLAKARKNLNFVYYRNLSLQVLSLATITYYCLAPFCNLN